MYNRKLLIAFVMTALSCGYFIQSPDSQTLVMNNGAAIQIHKEQHATAINEKIYSQSTSPLLTNPVPASLDGLDHNVVLLTDEHGNLIVNSDTLDLFEFYLSAMGEEPLENILIRIRHDIENQLTAAAKDQAFKLLKNFVDYKIELSSLANDLNNTTSSQLENLALQKASVASLRAKYFTPDTYQAFFLQEERYDEFMLAQLAIQQNSELDALQKKQQLDALSNELPDDIQRIRQTVSRHADLYQDAQDMRNNGASNEDIYQLRANTLGDDAASALAELDLKRNQWQQRLNQYAQQRDAILDSGLSDDDSQMAIDTLISQNFSRPESIRVKALDHTL